MSRHHGGYHTFWRPMNEAQIDPSESAWQWRASDGEVRPYGFDLAELWSPREFRAHVLRCLDRLEKGLVGRPEPMMLEIVSDIATAPDRYLELFTAEDFAPLLSARRARTRKLALQVLGHLQPSIRTSERARRDGEGDEDGELHR